MGTEQFLERHRKIDFIKDMISDTARCLGVEGAGVPSGVFWGSPSLRYATGYVRYSSSPEAEADEGYSCCLVKSQGNNFLDCVMDNNILRLAAVIISYRLYEWDDVVDKKKNKKKKTKQRTLDHSLAFSQLVTVWTGGKESAQFLSIFSFKNFEQNMGERDDPIGDSNKITEDVITGVVSFRIMLGDCRPREINFVATLFKC